MSIIPIVAGVRLPGPRCELYEIKSVLRCRDGSYLILAFIVDRAPLKEFEGFYVLRRPAPTLADPRPATITPTTERAISRYHGVLTVARNGAVHYVAHTKTEILFYLVAPEGTAPFVE